MAINFTNMLSILLKGAIGLFILAIIAFFVTRYLKRKKFKYQVELWEVDNMGNETLSYDQFGINIDKATNKEMGWLKNNKDCIGLDGFSYQVVRGAKGYYKLIRLLKIGEKSYVFLKPKIVSTANASGTITLNATREDVDWAINTYTRWTKTLQSKDRLREIIAMALMGTAIAVVFIIMILLIKNIPSIVDSLKVSSAQIASASQALKDAVLANRGVI
jgi:hypothetical protein